MLNVKDISKSFGNNKVLNRVSLDVNEGEIVGILGENGAGKSTLMRILSTMLSYDSGEACVNGHYIGKDDIEVRKSIGVLFGSEVGLYGNLTARENIDYFGRLNGMKSTKIQIDRLAEVLGFGDYLDKQARHLSRGMKQKVSFARAVVHDPPVILLDEPETGLDFVAAKTVFDFMLSCKKQGKAVFFSSHSMENIRYCSDRIILLRNGIIQYSGDMHQINKNKSDDEIRTMFYNMILGEEVY